MTGQWLAWAPQYVQDGAMASVTHVIMWIPPYLLPDPPEGAERGYWALQTRANWDAGTPQPDYIPFAYGVYDMDRIAEWAEQQAGYPVDLIPDMIRFRVRLRSRSEPMFYVVPAGIA